MQKCVGHADASQAKKQLKQQKLRQAQRVRLNRKKHSALGSMVERTSLAAAETTQARDSPVFGGTGLPLRTQNDAADGLVSGKGRLLLYPVDVYAQRTKLIRKPTTVGCERAVFIYNLDSRTAFESLYLDPSSAGTLL